MISAIFIIKTGVCLFSRQYGDSNVESERFSALIQGITQFAENISGGSLSKIMLGKNTYFLSVINDILFVFQYDDNKGSKLEKISTEVSTTFLKLFDHELQKFDGDTKVFDKFEKEVDSIISMEGKPIHKKMHDFASRF